MNHTLSCRYWFWKRKKYTRNSFLFSPSNFNEERLLHQQIHPGLNEKISFYLRERAASKNAHLAMLLLASFSAFGAKTPEQKIEYIFLLSKTVTKFKCSVSHIGSPLLCRSNTWNSSFSASSERSNTDAKYWLVPHLFLFREWAHLYSFWNTTMRRDRWSQNFLIDDVENSAGVCASEVFV